MKPWTQKLPSSATSMNWFPTCLVRPPIPLRQVRWSPDENGPKHIQPWRHARLHNHRDFEKKSTPEICISFVFDAVSLRAPFATCHGEWAAGAAALCARSAEIRTVTTSPLQGLCELLCSSPEATLPDRSTARQSAGERPHRRHHHILPGKVPPGNQGATRRTSWLHAVRALNSPRRCRGEWGVLLLPCVPPLLMPRSLPLAVWSGTQPSSDEADELALFPRNIPAPCTLAQCKTNVVTFYHPVCVCRGLRLLT